MVREISVTRFVLTWTCQARLLVRSDKCSRVWSRSVATTVKLVSVVSRAVWAEARVTRAARKVCCNSSVRLVGRIQLPREPLGLRRFSVIKARLVRVGWVWARVLLTWKRAALALLRTPAIWFVNRKMLGSARSTVLGGA